MFNCLHLPSHLLPVVVSCNRRVQPVSDIHRVPSVSSQQPYKMMFKWSVMCLCLASVAVVRCAPAAQSSSEEQGRAITGANLFSDLRYAYSLYQGCAHEDLATCLKVNMLTTLDRVSRNNKDIAVSENVKIVAADHKDEDETPVLTKESIEQSLPRSLSAQDSALNAMLLKKFMSMISKYSVQVSLSSAEYQ